MRVITVLRCAAALLLLLSTGNASSAVNYQQRTDAQAGCTYGTRELQPSDYPGGFATYADFRNFGSITKQAECNVSWQWFPAESGWGISYLMAGPTSAFSYFDVEPSDPVESRTQVLCTGFDDPRCSPSNFATKPKGGILRMVAETYHCDTDTDYNCVSDIDVIAPDGTVSKASFVRHIPDVPKLAGAHWTTKYADGRVESQAASPGRAPALWKYTTADGTRYLLTKGLLEQSWDTSQSPGQWGRPFQTMHFALFPVEEAQWWNTRAIAVQEVRESDANGVEYINVKTFMPRETNPKPASFIESPKPCTGFAAIQSEDHACVLQTDFPKGYRFRIGLQMEDVAGFSFMARLDQPIAYSDPIPNGHRLTLEAAPATSYLVSASVPKAVMKPDFLAAVQKSMVFSAPLWTLNPVDNPPMENRDPDFLAALAPYIEDRSQFKYDSWSFYTMPVFGGMSQQCSDLVKGQVVSITSTNATAYDQKGPTFDQQTKTFNFKAASPHFEPDGKTKAVGHYYMNMNAKFMQCVLGTPKVPDVATVALDYTNGEANVATVTVHQDKDWLRLAADNFHFSSPKITVSFPTTPKPSKVAPKAKPSVTCVKGKTSKKFSASKCPSGWKKA